MEKAKGEVGEGGRKSVMMRKAQTELGGLLASDIYMKISGG